MKTVHIFADSYYVIGNRAVAKSFMFKEESDCKRFKSKIKEHLEGLCDILSFGFGMDEFRLVIKTRTREEIEEYFKNEYWTINQIRDSYSEMGLEPKIPDTTYIFAQAMANWQSGYVKYFNFKYTRDGGLMAGRYTRKLIESEEDLDQIIEEVNEMKISWDRDPRWKYQKHGDGISIWGGKERWRSSKKYYQDEAIICRYSWFKLKSQVYLRGHFDKLPPKRLDPEDSQKKLQNLLAFIFLKLK